MSEINLSSMWGRHFEFFVPPRVSGHAATFENGATLKVAEDGSVDLAWACGTSVAHGLSVPRVRFDDGEPEWRFERIEVEVNCAVLCYSSQGGRTLRWLFKTGHGNLDGRMYQGVADQVVVPAGARQVSFSAKIAPGDPLKVRRMSVDAGYGEAPATSFSGRWKPFEDGQPFTYLVGTKGVYSGMPTGLEDLTVGFSAAGGDALETREVVLAPEAGETQFFWRWYSAGEENGNNDYLARWQYVRQFLRRRYGLREWPATPGMKFVADGQKPTYGRLGELRAREASGSRVVSTGMDPLVLDGADVSRHDLGRAPFALVGGAWKRVRGVDAFTAAAYGAFPAEGASPDGAVAASVAEALRLCVMPFVRETPFGTVWVGKDGGAIFFLKDADDVDVKLPTSWTIRGVKGARLKGVKAGTVYVLESSNVRVRKD